MRRTALALTSLLLLVGFTAACGDDDDKSETKGTSSASSAKPDADPTPADPGSDGAGGSPTAPPSDLLPPADPSTIPRTGPDAKFCTTVDKADAAEDIEALKPAVKLLVATLPTSAGDEAKAGLAFLNKEVQAAKDFDDMGARLEKATEAQQKQVGAYGQYEEETCD